MLFLKFLFGDNFGMPKLHFPYRISPKHFAGEASSDGHKTLVPHDFDAYGGKPVQQTKVEAPCVRILVSSLR